MNDCVVVLSLPNKLNTRYSVLTINVEDLYGVFSWQIFELELEQLNARKVLIFCRKRAHVRELYVRVKYARRRDLWRIQPPRTRSVRGLYTP